MLNFAMAIEIKDLPNDIKKLKEIISDLSEKYKAVENASKEKDHKIIILTEKNKILEHRLFGTKSEKSLKINPDQLKLFNEVELAKDGFIINEEKTKDNYVTIKSYTRSKKGRKPIPEHLPRKEIIHDLSDDEKRCKCCNKKRPKLAPEITEELSYIPAKFYVKKHIRYKYGNCGCEESIKNGEPSVIIACMPQRLISGSIVSPELLAYIITCKYVDGLPLYRIEKMLKRKGIRILRQTMSNWIIQAGSKISDLIKIMHEEIRSGPLIQMDETSLQVLKEPGKPATSKSYMWVSVGYKENKKIIVYTYHPSRSKEVPLSLLKEYKGYLQTDGYSAYNDAVEKNGIIHVGCFAHARRKFNDVLKGGAKSESAKWAIDNIKKLYIIENKLREELDNEKITKDQFEKERKEEAYPVLNKINQWLLKLVEEVPSSILLGKAINYSLNQWDNMVRYLDKWFLTPDNNRAENAIRPFVLGRKNWLFCNTPSGAYASAGFYSLIETAKANGIEPFNYLYYLFDKLPRIDTSQIDELKKILPSQLEAKDFPDQIDL